MHPDRKIGIAMGILLIGIVAALFFRNEPLQSETSGLSELRERQLNQKLKDRDAPLYLDTDEDLTASRVDVDTPSWTQDSTLEDLFKQMNKNETVPAPIGLRAVPKAKRSPSSGTELAQLTIPPSQSQTEPEEDGPKNEPLPSADEANEFASILKSDQQSTTAPKTDGRKSEPKFREYVVQYGDTLSEISEKFLGSQARYKEIFEANKDRMASPDQLRVGKAIRIPQIH